MALGVATVDGRPGCGEGRGGEPQGGGPLLGAVPGDEPQVVLVGRFPLDRAQDLGPGESRDPDQVLGFAVIEGPRARRQKVPVLLAFLVELRAFGFLGAGARDSGQFQVAFPRRQDLFHEPGRLVHEFCSEPDGLLKIINNA